MSEPDFIERNGTWVLSIAAMCFSCIGGVFAYALKSRCVRVQCCCISCDRQPLPADVVAQVTNSDPVSMTGVETV